MEWIRLPLIHPAAFCQEIEMDELIMTCMQIYPIMAEARKFHIMGVTGDSHRFNPRSKGFGQISKTSMLNATKNVWIRNENYFWLRDCCWNSANVRQR